MLTSGNIIEYWQHGVDDAMISRHTSHDSVDCLKLFGQAAVAAALEEAVEGARFVPMQIGFILSC